METLGRHSAHLKELRRRVRDRRDGEVIVDGRRLVADVVRWGVPIRELYVAADSPLDTEIVDAAEQAWELAPSVFASVAPTKNPQGVLAVVDEPDHEPWPAVDGVALYLDRVRDPGNLGAVARCAAGLGAAAVILSPGCADPFGWAAVRSSAGAVLGLPIDRGVGVRRVVQQVRDRGGEVWATAARAEPLQDWRPRRPTLLLFGAEGPGLDDASITMADGAVSIELDRGIDSLNVAVAAGILLHHLRHL